MTLNPYFQGDLVNVTTGSTGFVDANGDAVDPTGLTLTVGRRGATGAETYTYGVGDVIVKDSVGNYEADIDTTLFVPDAWWYRWEGTGAAQAVNEGTFLVLPVDV